MTKGNRRAKNKLTILDEETGEKIILDHIYCKTCNSKINQNVLYSDKLKGECNRCYNSNTLKHHKRRNNKRRTLQRKKQREMKSY